MYGLIVMATLATGPEAPSFGWGTDSGGCYGSACYGSACYGSSCFGSGCYGSSCYGSGCTGSSCYGSSCVGSCHGSNLPLFPRLRARLASFGCHGRSSCYGSGCTGSSCYGSSCYGSSCYGSSCYGSSFGESYVGGSCFGTSTYAPSPVGYGVSSGPIYYGSDFHPMPGVGCQPGFGTIITPAPMTGVPQVKIDRSTEYQVAKAKPNAAPARLTIDLPADAKLFVDGTATKGEGNTRNFHTPDLPTGQTFYYELKAELLVDGKPVTETKTVLVKAGDVLTESFPKVLAAAATARAKDALAKR